MTPLELYKRDIESPEFIYDSAQEQVIHHVQALYQELLDEKNISPGVWQKFSRKLGYSKKFIRGLYIWGGVGRGKTYIFNSLYQTLSNIKKRRVHFHQFMQSIHEQLNQFKSQANPLELIAKQMSRSVRVLFIDEFHVQDIADAMLLAGIIKPLFENNIVLITTSNIAPDLLYKDGLQRDKFLPAIAQIKQHTLEIELTPGVDYRLGNEEVQADLAESKLQATLKAEGISEDHYDRQLAINNRLITSIAANSNIAWFEFDEICNTPRSTSDYLRLAELYKKIAISHIPIFTEANENAAIRFIHLIDALYDFNVQLLYVAETVPEKLYQGRLHAFPFQRTASRLIEMASRPIELRTEDCGNSDERQSQYQVGKNNQ